jgi:hypothetical protein
VDAAEGQGTTLKFDLDSAVADRYFEVDTANGKDAAVNGGTTYFTGFRVVNGTDVLGIYRNSANKLDFCGDINDTTINIGNNLLWDTENVQRFDSKTASQNLREDITGDYYSVKGANAASLTGLTAASGVQSFLTVDAPINQSGTAGYNALLVDVDVNAEGSGEKNLIKADYGGAIRFRVDTTGAIVNRSSTADGSTDLIRLADSAAATQFRVDSDGHVRIGTGTPGVATGAGDNYGAVRWRATAQTPDTTLWMTGIVSNAIVVCEYDDRSFDFAHALQTNPTLFIQSANQSLTEWLSLAHDQTHARLNTGTGAVCIGTGTPGVATGAGDLFVTGDIELVDTLYLKNDKPVVFGNVGYCQMKFSTVQTPDTLMIGTASISNSLIIAELGDLVFDFAHALQTNPTLFGHSANQSTTEWWSLTHNQTDAVLTSGAGALSLAPASGAVNLVVSQAAATSMLVNNASDNAAADSQTEWRSGTSVESSLIVGQRNTAYTTAVYRDRGYMITDTDSLGILIAARKTTGTIDFYAGESTPTNKRISVTSSGVSMGDAAQTLYDVAPASDHTATGDTVSATVDTNATGISAALYQASDGNWDEAKADAIATMPCRALALESGTGTKLILRRGWIRDDSWAWTPGAPVYVSTTTGALTQTKPSTTGDQVQIVGYAETADILDFNPSTVIVEVA